MRYVDYLSRLKCDRGIVFRSPILVQSCTVFLMATMEA